MFINRSPAKGQGRRLELDEDCWGISATVGKPTKYQLVETLTCPLQYSDLLQVRNRSIGCGAEGFQISITLRKLGARANGGQQLKWYGLDRHRADLDSAWTTGGRDLRVWAGVTRGSGGLITNRQGRVGSSKLDSQGDINEEVVRLKSHVEALSRVLAAREPVGKKVDFMLQEVQRELNTISSKVPHLPVVQLVLEGKERVEKIREQTQNIE